MRKWPTKAERVEIMLCLSRPNLSLLTFLCANFLFIAPETNAQEESPWVVTPNVNALDDFNVTPNSPALAKALTDASQYVIRWQLPADKRGWKARRPQVKAAFRKALGLERLPERTPLNARARKAAGCCLPDRPCTRYWKGHAQYSKTLHNARQARVYFSGL